MKWPMSDEFNEAIQSPGAVFLDPDLKTGEAVVGARGLPLPRSGNFADVYQIRGKDGRDWAVKCFTRPVPGLGDRYKAIGAALSRAGLPFTIGFTYLEEGIRIQGKLWPIVKMEWVEGLLLNQVVRENAGKPTALAALGVMWSRLSKRLRENKIAHADLQHGNVLMVPGSRPGAYGLKLIDYDGMYVPALANQPSGESGHPAYQHPRRTSTAGYSPDLDRFPHLLIAAALKSLEACGPGLWERYDSGDNLLFTEDDLKSPAASNLMRELWQTESPAVQALVGRLAVAALRPIPQTPWLDQVAPEGEPVPLDDEARRQAFQALGIAAPVAIPLPPEPSASTPAAVPLSPEPSVSTPWSDLVEEPAIVSPNGFSSRPSQTRLSPMRPQPGDVDVELVEPAARAGKPKSKRSEEEPAKSSASKLLLVAGCVVVLGVGAVVAVMMSGGKPGTETAAVVEPERPAETERAAKSKELPRKPDQSHAKAESPRDETPNPVVPSPPTEKPIIGIPGKPGFPIPLPPSVVLPPGAAATNWTIKELKTFPVAPVLPRLGRFDHDGRHLVLCGLNRVLTVFDPQSGEQRRLNNLADQSPGTPYMTIQDGHVITWSPGGAHCIVSDVDTGKLAGKINFPDLPTAEENKNPSAVVAVSPDSRYVAAGRRPSANPMIKTMNPVPFRVLDTLSGKEVLSIEWTGGSIVFSSDSSRVLVYENTGRGRWFKLPSGEADVEWKLGPIVPGVTVAMLEAASRNGGRLLCWGLNRGHFILDGDQGTVLSGFGIGHHLGSGCLSEDGRVAAVLNRNTAPGGETELVVYDAARGVEVARVRVPASAAGFAAMAGNGRRLAVFGRQQNSDAVVYDLDRPAGLGELVQKPKDPADSAGPGAVTPRESVESSGPLIVKPGAKGPLDLKPRWTAAASGVPASRFYSEPAAGVVVLGTGDAFLALDSHTGVPKKDLTPVVVRKPRWLFPLEHEKFGTLTAKASDIDIWEAKTGKLVERLTAPISSLPAGPARAADLYLELSPNKKFMALGRLGRSAADHPDAPFKLIEAATRKVLAPIETWQGGSVHFTEDSTRVLVAEWTGRCRWFKLPSGEDAGSWAREKPVARAYTLHAISADGAVAAASGMGNEGGDLGIISGKTGRPRLLFGKDYDHHSPVALSANGRLTAVVRVPMMGGPPGQTIDVIEIGSGTVIAQAKFDSGSSLPTFGFTADGTALLVHDASAQKVYSFDLAAAGG